ncbi:hypothetical protein Hjap01_04310 [Haloarcula japonica]
MEYEICIVASIESVIEELSHRDDRATWIVSTFVVGDCDDEPKAQSEKVLVAVGS